MADRSDEVLEAILERLDRIERRLGAAPRLMTPADVELLGLIEASRIGRVAFSSADLHRHLGDALGEHELTDLRKIGRRLGAIVRRQPVGSLRLVAAGRSSSEGRLYQVEVADDGRCQRPHRPRPSGSAPSSTASLI